MKHDLYMDSEPVHTDDGDPQPRSSIFIECLDMKCECGGKFIIRDGEIPKLINDLQEELERTRAALTAAGELLEVCIPSCIVYSKCHSWGDAYLHTADCKYTEKKQAYRAALTRLEQETP